MKLYINLLKDYTGSLIDAAKRFNPLGDMRSREEHNVALKLWQNAVESDFSVKEKADSVTVTLEVTKSLVSNVGVKVLDKQFYKRLTSKDKDLEGTYINL